MTNFAGDIFLNYRNKIKLECKDFYICYNRFLKNNSYLQRYF